MCHLNPQIKPVDSICLSFLGECQGSLRMIRKKWVRWYHSLAEAAAPCEIYTTEQCISTALHPLLLFLSFSLYVCPSDSVHVELPPAPMIWSCPRFFPVTLAVAWVVTANLDCIGWNINKDEPVYNCCVKEHKWFTSSQNKSVWKIYEAKFTNKQYSICQIKLSDIGLKVLTVVCRSEISQHVCAWVVDSLTVRPYREKMWHQPK